MKKFLSLNDIGAYRIAFHLSNKVWEIVSRWDYFAKDTLGKQFVRAADSISANLAEGFGRYTKRDKIHFWRYSLGSVYEALDCNEKAKRRGLICEKQYQAFYQELQSMPQEIRSLINFVEAKLTK